MLTLSLPVGLSVGWLPHWTSHGFLDRLRLIGYSRIFYLCKAERKIAITTP